MSPETLLHGALWFISGLWVVEHIVSATRTPKRNKKLEAPSIHCDRTGDWRANLPGMARRQGD